MSRELIHNLNYVVAFVGAVTGVGLVINSILLGLPAFDDGFSLSAFFQAFQAMSSGLFMAVLMFAIAYALFKKSAQASNGG